MKNKTLYIIIFAALFVFIALLGFYFTEYLKEKQKKEVYSNLSTLAQLKIRTVENWRAERESEARFLFSSTYLSEYISDLSVKKNLKNVTEFLKPFIIKPDYGDIIITPLSGGSISLKNRNPELTAEEKTGITDCIIKKQFNFKGPEKHPDGKLFMEIFIPVLNINRNEVKATLLLRIDPWKELFPLITSNSSFRKTLESFIVTAEKDSVVFINKLKFNNKAPFSFKLPLTMTDLPAVMAVKGYKGIYEGIDYVGNKVLADLNQIPHSPWFIVSKINLDEVYAPVKSQLIYVFGGAIALLIICGLIIYSGWKHQRINYLNRQLELEKETHAFEQELKISGERYNHMFNSIMIGIAVADFHGNIIEANDYFLRIVGYTRAEFEKGNIGWDKITPPEYHHLDQKAIDELKAYGVCVPYEKEFISKDGTRRWVLIADTNYPGKDQQILSFVIDITERKNAEKTIISSEEKFAKIFNNSPISMALVIYPELTIADVNKAFENIYGHKREDAIGKTSLDLDMYEDIAARAAIVNGIKSGNLKEREVNIIRKDGAKRVVVVTNEWIEIENKKYILSMSLDITDRRKAEEALLESESKLLETQELANLGSWELNLATGILNWSDETYRIFGLNPRELTPSFETFINCVHPDDRKAVDDTFFGSIQDGRNSFDMEHRIIKKDTGEIRNVHEKCKHIRNESGEVIRSVGMTQDITERIKAREALLSSEERFYKAFSANPNALIISNIENGKILEINDTFTNIFGYSRDEAIGKTTYELNIYVNPEDRERAIASVKKEERLRDFEIRLRLKNGAEIISLLSIDLLKMNKGGTILTTIQDISERKKTEIKLQGTLRELIRSNKDLEEFAYTASHDLQEPIRMIKSYAQLLELKNHDSLDNSAKMYLEYISEGASRMQQLVDDLLKYSRVSTTKREFDLVDCNIIVSDVLKDFRFRIEEEQAAIQVNALPVVKGDETQLRQVFQNFIHNALKFRSEKKPEIKIGCEQKNGSWLFSISDNGIGIDSMFYDRIFVIFQRLHERDKYPGTGIGLALCKKIIERHGGQVCVDSEQGKGTTFYFTIPLKS